MRPRSPPTSRENVVLEPDPESRLRRRRLRAFAGHSFRRGRITASQRAGLVLDEIGANTGQTVVTVARYVENRQAVALAVTTRSSRAESVATIDKA